MKEFSTDKFKFYCKYLVPQGQVNKFINRLNSLNLAVQINPELAEEAKKQLIEEYPFTKEFLE